MRRSIFFLLLAFLSPQLAFADWQADFLGRLGNGSVFVEDANGKTLFSHRIDEHFVPASTIKMATAACALKALGPEFRFVTDFFLTADGQLFVKGYGDPMLVSEEFARIARALKAAGVRRVQEIGLDAGFFSPQIVIDGVERSSNPYDALNGALLANFNTMNVRKSKSGQIQSAEPQTPLTPLVVELARRLPPGTHRVNLAGSQAQSIRYVGELLGAFLVREGIAVEGPLREGVVPADAKLVYRHASALQLADVTRGLLEFSTNLTANQLFLVLGAHRYGAPATVEKGVQALAQCLRQDVGWKDFTVAEGSGLSRQTQVTARQMIQLLRYFLPYRDLLPRYDTVFQAKTGTLNGANTFAGYFPLARGGLARFVILVAEKVPYDYKFRLARLLYAGINGVAPPVASKR
ncbi:MAG: D-alanyl-D-alanine carboxypeptidase [Deltaproteobacteria bacterium]|nr:D-alanyl-D-alanine carboxypeptidase [Deltaproteobacteria bacterium]